MILLDTHICIWWITNSDRLSERHRGLIKTNEREGIGISAFTIWEIALLAAKGRIELLQFSTQHWLQKVLLLPTLQVIPASPQILVDSTEFPGDFHRDPADRIIVATARSLACVLLTADAPILGYPHIRTEGLTA